MHSLVHACLNMHLCSLYNYVLILICFCISERLKEDQRINEDLYEKRMDLLTKSVKKSRKRPRIECIEDEDDEWVSSVSCTRNKLKLR